MRRTLSSRRMTRRLAPYDNPVTAIGGTGRQMPGQAVHGQSAAPRRPPRPVPRACQTCRLAVPPRPERARCPSPYRPGAAASGRHAAQSVSAPTSTGALHTNPDAPKPAGPSLASPALATRSVLSDYHFHAGVSRLDSCVFLISPRNSLIVRGRSFRDVRRVSPKWTTAWQLGHSGTKSSISG